MPKIRHKLVYSALVFERKELQSMVANSLSAGLEVTQVLPKFVDITDVSYNHNTREMSIDYSINFADILRTSPSPEAMEDSDEY